jgi:hypothetical protein
MIIANPIYDVVFKRLMEKINLLRNLEINKKIALKYDRFYSTTQRPE